MLRQAVLLCAIAAFVAGRPHSMGNIIQYGDDRLESDPYDGAMTDDFTVTDSFHDEAQAAGQEWVAVPVGTKWQNRAWCGAGENCHNQAIPTGAKLVNVDLFDTSAAVIQELAKKYIVTCYFSAGTYEVWRPDANKFTTAVKGLKMTDWDETWLDIRRLDLLKPIMQARMKLAVEKGCHGVEPDNIDCWQQSNCVSGKSAGDTAMYNQQLVYNRWMASYAHSLGMNIGHKNNLDQIKHLATDFDWGMNESCHAYNECSLMLPFIELGKGVLAAEYKGVAATTCTKGRGLKFSQKVDKSGMWLDC